MPRTSAPASERVVERVAAESNRDALELPPLYDAVDPDALDALVEGLSEGEVEFCYAGYEVSVNSDGAVAAIERPAGERSTGAVADD